MSLPPGGKANTSDALTPIGKVRARGERLPPGGKADAQEDKKQKHTDEIAARREGKRIQKCLHQV